MKTKNVAGIYMGAVLALFVAGGCRPTYKASADEQAETAIDKKETTKVQEKEEAPEPKAPQYPPYDRSADEKRLAAIKYVGIPFSRDTLAELDAKLGPNGMETVIKLNHKDRKRLNKNDVIIVPEPIASMMEISPFPHRIPLIDSVPKAILISRKIQAIAAYQDGKLVHWAPTSTGKKSTPTPAGYMHTNWKTTVKRSTVNNEWILKWYFNLLNYDGVSLHLYEMPGYPASHSCIRMFEDDAKWIWNWADQWKLSKGKKLAEGTPVIIFDDWDWGGVKPWVALQNDPLAMQVSLDHAEEVIRPHLPKMMREKYQRENLLRPSTPPPATPPVAAK